MDILKQITAVPNIHAYLLLQSRGLSAVRIRHALLLASASILRAYAVSNQQQEETQGPQKLDTLQFKVDIRSLAARLDLSPSFTMTLVESLVPDVVARLQRRLRGDSTLLHQLNEPPFAA